MAARSNSLKWIYTTTWILCFLENFYVFASENSTLPTTTTTTQSPRRHGRDSNIIPMLQQIMQQLGTIEVENQQQSAQIRDVQRLLTRLDIQRQDLVSLIDRTESRLTQRLDDMRGDIRKIITLQEVLREDVDKLQQNQLMTKVWFEEQLRQMKEGLSYDNKKETTLETTPSSFANADVLANLQVVQTTLYSLRRISDGIQHGINILKTNVTDLMNFTRYIYRHTEGLPTKEYLLSVLRNLLPEPQLPQIVTCFNPPQPQAPQQTISYDCKDIQDQGHNRSGIYRIQPEFSPQPFFVYCDMETENGGWTVFQRRKDGSVDFMRDWVSYKRGFGNVAGEFWLGNDNIHRLTNQGVYELRIDLYDFDDGHASAKYSAFAIGNEKENYMLKVLGKFVAGEAGDGMGYHVSMEFSTMDADNDRWAGGNCAKDHTGGWWYNQCDASNLNGQYLGGLTQQEYQGVYWYEWQGPSYSLRAVEMKIRPVTSS